MYLAHLRLRDFRNYARLDVEFSPGFHLLLGDNAQGKTNILEAIYLLATLRSFRGAGGAQMVRHGQKGYFAGGKVVAQGEHEIKMYWSAQQRSDGQGHTVPHGEGCGRGMESVARRAVASQAVTVSSAICASSRSHTAITSRLKAWWRSQARRKHRPS